ncbi:type I-E CRISPR-associated protein Cas7/Cse4/CasC [Streptomyces sp. NPDC029674]|uniref:type I-E CRISPR-associated protein Cas7/Cse4/CasC n=1 Tax=Streptomyces sp. NPDC029674 TaxID=3365297 RepID=UPI00384FB484
MSITLTRRAFIDIHILQTTPPANLNRDDAGSPKEAIYGGVRRPRASSQAWKRATRIAFTTLGINADDLGTRTKRIAADLADRLAARTNLDEEAAARVAAAMLIPLGVTASTKKAAETAYLLFYGQRQLEQLVDLVADQAHALAELEDKQLKDKLKGLDVRKAITTGHPIDVALFGRMVADVPGINVDAACQVAHALATHAAELEFDWYTAVDDRNEKSETGAGMMGRIGFNSATFYRYATVGLHQLDQNLTDPAKAIETAAAFIQAFTRSMPAGYGNSFGHRTMPQLVALNLRTDQPVNLVTAFEKPITTRTGGYAAPSARALAREYQTIATQWGAPALWTGITHNFTDDSDTAAALSAAFGEPQAFPVLLDQLTDRLRALGQDQETK